MIKMRNVLFCVLAFSFITASAAAAQNRSKYVLRPPVSRIKVGETAVIKVDEIKSYRDAQGRPKQEISVVVTREFKGKEAGTFNLIIDYKGNKLEAQVIVAENEEHFIYLFEPKSQTIEIGQTAFFHILKKKKVMGMLPDWMYPDNWHTKPDAFNDDKFQVYGTKEFAGNKPGEFKVVEKIGSQTIEADVIVKEKYSDFTISLQPDVIEVERGQPAVFKIMKVTKALGLIPQYEKIADYPVPTDTVGNFDYSVEKFGKVATGRVIVKEEEFALEIVPKSSTIKVGVREEFEVYKVKKSGIFGSSRKLLEVKEFDAREPGTFTVEAQHKGQRVSATVIVEEVPQDELYFIEPQVLALKQGEKGIFKLYKKRYMPDVEFWDDSLVYSESVEAKKLGEYIHVFIFDGKTFKGKVVVTSSSDDQGGGFEEQGQFSYDGKDIEEDTGFDTDSGFAEIDQENQDVTALNTGNRNTPESQTTQPPAYQQNYYPPQPQQNYSSPPRQTQRQSQQQQASQSQFWGNLFGQMGGLVRQANQMDQQQSNQQAARQPAQLPSAGGVTINRAGIQRNNTDLIYGTNNSSGISSGPVPERTSGSSSQASGGAASQAQKNALINEVTSLHKKWYDLRCKSMYSGCAVEPNGARDDLINRAYGAQTAQDLSRVRSRMQCINSCFYSTQNQDYSLLYGCMGSCPN